MAVSAMLPETGPGLLPVAPPAATLVQLQPDRMPAKVSFTETPVAVDGPALLAALRAGRLGAAGIDVLPEEPPASGNPLLEARLPNLLVTPHIAWAAREARQRALDEVVANIRAFLDGEADNKLS